MRSDSLLARWSVILSTMTGFQVLYLVVIIFVGSCLNSRPIPADPSTFPNSILIVNGQPLLSKHHYNVQESWLRTLDGAVTTLADKQPVESGTSLSTINERGPRRNLMHLHPLAWNAAGMTVGRNFTEPWFFVQEYDQGEFSRGYFVNYSKTKLAPVRYLGTHGTSTTVPARDQQFEFRAELQAVVSEEGYSLLYDRRSAYWEETVAGGYEIRGDLHMVTPKGLERIDLAKGQATTTVAESEPQSLGEHYASEYDERSRRISNQVTGTLLLRGKTTVFAITNFQVQSKYVIPDGLREQNLQVYPIDSQTVYYATSDLPNGPYYAPEKLYRCDDQGRIVQQWDVPQPPPFVPNRLGNQLAAAILCPAPMAIPPLLGFETAVAGKSRTEVSQTYAIPIAILFVAGVLSALGAWVLTPRFSGTTATPSWLAFVFITGLPGLVAYLLHFRRRVYPVLAPSMQVGTEIFA